jgi:hypothetical protein
MTQKYIYYSNIVNSKNFQYFKIKYISVEIFLSFLKTQIFLKYMYVEKTKIFLIDKLKMKFWKIGFFWYIND